MKVIQENTNASGAYPAIQNLGFIPDGWLQIADDCDTTPFYEAHGFVTLTITDGIVTAFTANTATWEAWKAAHPETPAQHDPVTQTQLALAELAETEASHDLENKLALAELAEMIGGTSNG